VVFLFSAGGSGDAASELARCCWQTPAERRMPAVSFAQLERCGRQRKAIQHEQPFLLHFSHFSEFSFFFERDNLVIVVMWVSFWANMVDSRCFLVISFVVLTGIPPIVSIPPKFTSANKRVKTFLAII
jgi:hypothetical protein